jgi:FKBP12-rapamycin complex-associated protein
MKLEAVTCKFLARDVFGGPGNLEGTDTTFLVSRLAVKHRLYLAYLHHMWLTDAREEATSRLVKLCEVVDLVSTCEAFDDKSLCVTCWLELGEWTLAQATSATGAISDRQQADVWSAFKRATAIENCGYRAWHAWALFNFRVAAQLGERYGGTIPSGRGPSDQTQRYVIAAVKGFVNAISIGTRKESASVQQDLLNLLACLFKYGSIPDVSLAIKECIGAVELEAWLGVLPQVLARIHIKDPNIRAVLYPLLVRLGQKHPQAMMYPLSVLLKSPVIERKLAAESLMNTLKEQWSELAEEALMVSSELIRVAILWLETWHEGLEDASRLYFVEGNVSAMLDILLPLHQKVEAGGETMLEREFLKNYGHDLATAHMHIKDYTRLVNEGGSSVPTGSSASVQHGRQSEEAEAAMNRAWDIYYTFFRRVNKQLPSLTSLELSQCSPALYRARSLELGVPGTYRVDGSYVKTDKFVSNINVITSKQRPRKITVRGSDGNDYTFLLKGHEDLRQDERVMQLFGLVNALLVRDPQTRKHDLKIQRYAICPLSHNCGVVGWVPHCDTLHSLIVSSNAIRFVVGL